MNENKTIDLELKVSMEEMKRIGDYCVKHGFIFSQWLREIALKEIEKEEKKDSPSHESIIKS